MRRLSDADLQRFNEDIDHLFLISKVPDSDAIQFPGGRTLGELIGQIKGEVERRKEKGAAHYAGNEGLSDADLDRFNQSIDRFLAVAGALGWNATHSPETWTLLDLIQLIKVEVKRRQEEN